MLPGAEKRHSLHVHGSWVWSCLWIMKTQMTCAGSPSLWAVTPRKLQADFFTCNNKSEAVTRSIAGKCSGVFLMFWSSASAWACILPIIQWRWLDVSFVHPPKGLPKYQCEVPTPSCWNLTLIPELGKIPPNNCLLSPTLPPQDPSAKSHQRS